MINSVMYIRNKYDLKFIDKNTKKIIIHHSYYDNISELKDYEIDILDLLNYYGTIYEFPKNLKHIIFNYNFNCPLDNLPNTLEILDLKNSNFNYSVDNLPINLKILKIGNSFNYEVDNLPNSLKVLTLGLSFNKKINLLPSSLKKLKIDGNFNQSIDNLPNNLTYLILNNNYNDDITILPNLEFLEIGHKFNKNIYYLPYSLKALIFNINTFDSNVKININEGNYNNLISLDIHSDVNIDFNKFKSLKYLKINQIKSDISNKINNLEKLKYLVLSFNRNIKISKINNNVEYLKFVGNFNEDLDFFTLPKNLKYLYLGYSYNKPLLNLPEGLKYLFVENYIEHLKIPSSVIGLHMTHLNTTKLDLPNNLEYLDMYILNFDFDYNNNDYVIMPNLPDSIKYLSISSKINILKDEYVKLLLKKNLKYLSLNHKIIINYSNFNYNNNILMALDLDETYFNSYLWIEKID
jgi:hypothetical protein